MIKKDQRLNHVNRIWELDFIRGICISAMIFNHFLLIMLFFYSHYWDIKPEGILGKIIDFAYYAFSNGNNIRSSISYAVLSFFFLLAGISSILSYNNKTRAFKLGLMTLLMQLFSFIISNLFNIEVYILFGVFACYLSCLLIYIIAKSISKHYKSNAFFYSIMVFFILISVIILIFGPYAKHTNLFMFLGIPKKDGNVGFEYFPIFPWLGVFNIGVLSGNLLYKAPKSLLPFKYPNKEVFSYIGRNGLKAYILHIPFIISIIFLMDLIFN